MSRNKLVAAIAISITLLGLPGCIGRMALTGKVQEFNLEVAENDFLEEGVFLGLHIVPVYPLAAFVDLLVINSIEFWTGENPVSGQPAIVDESAGGE